MLDHEHFYHVSPAYAKRFQRMDETEAEYVERLRQELDDKFLELGPETVIGCKSRPAFHKLRIKPSVSHSCGRDRSWSNNRRRSSPERVSQR